MTPPSSDAGRPRRIAALVLTGLTLLALGGAILTARWGDIRQRLRAMQSSTPRRTAVDTRALDVAQQLAQLAETRTEKAYAAEATRLGDYAVDFAFAAAIRDAANAPPPTTTETKQITAHLRTASAAVAADQSRIAALSAQVSNASAKAGDGVAEQLDLARAQLELDQDDLDDAHQDLIRAGGDRLATITRLRDQHDTATHAAVPGASTGGAPAAVAVPSIELTKSSNIVDQADAWFSINAKLRLLAQARQSAVDRSTSFAGAHDTLEKQVVAEKAAQRILHPRGRNAANIALLRPATGAGAERSSPAKASADHADTAAANPPATALSFIQDLTVDQKDLSELDKRVENEQDLATLYGNWIAYLRVRQQSFVHGIIVSAFWILLIALLVVIANQAVRHVFSDLTARRGLHTLRSVTLFCVQAAGILVIVLLVFGMPSNFATVIALAGAGLALALQDFIVGFFGWFVLMGKDGMRPGDWVEINGVGGEVLDVGVFRTVLLETSDWSGSADPTGRKVSFVNSFAIEGHYFNFSTSGQWLWDELEIEVPAGMDPYAVAEEIQRAAARETGVNADAAEQEWQRVVPSRVGQAFSAEPSVSVRPSGAGVTVLVRYLTRASDRQAIRARMYRAMITLLHGNGSVTAEPAGAVRDASAG